MQIIKGWYFKMARWSNVQQMYLSQTGLVLQDWHVIVSIKTKCTHWNKNNCARRVKHFNIVIISGSYASTSDYQFCLMWITWFLSLPQVGGSTEAFLKAGPTQPFVLCVGERKNIIQSFYIVLDQKVIPCVTQMGVAGFDKAKLFKAHFLFAVSFDKALNNFYTFIQTTVYGIDVGSVKESPRVRETRGSLHCTV